MAPFLSAPWPTLAVEIAPHRVTVVEVRGSAGGSKIRAHSTQPVPEGAVRPTPTGSNVVDSSAVVRALRAALQAVGGRHHQVGLVIPDAAAKVSLVRFDNVPSREADLGELIRWQVRKSAPFKIEEAQVTYTPGSALASGGREFVVVLARTDVVEEYERVCTDSGLAPGVVDLASLNLITAVLAGQRDARAGWGDWLLVHVEPAYLTLAIVRGDAPVFYRSTMVGHGEGLADFVHQTAMYYEDRLGGGGFGRAVVAGAGNVQAGEAEIREALTDRVGCPVDMIDPRGAAHIHGRAHVDQATLDALAPAVGLLVRQRAA